MVSLRSLLTPDYLEEQAQRISAARTIRAMAVEGIEAKLELKRMDERQSAMRANVEKLKAKLAAASNVVPQVTQHLEAHADRILSRGEDIMNRSDKVCAPHEAMLDETDHGLDDLDAMLQVMGNGPPLPSGESSTG